ncbi:MAG: flavin reductase [Firmicutes bacterium]|nr:flavin reductase [Bacillota bacterium]
MPKIDPALLDFRATYRLLVGSIVPRPIAWVSTVDPTTGLVNLAPFSAYMLVSVVPPMVAFSVGREGGVTKDTLRNIEASREYVVNLATSALATAVSISAQELPPEVSEVEVAGLHTVPSELVKVPRVAESPVQMECRLHTILDFGLAPHRLVIGEVVQWHVKDDLYANGKINMERLDALGRMAGDVYCRTDHQFTAVRPDRGGSYQ